MIVTNPQNLSATHPSERDTLKALARGRLSAVDIGTFRGGTAHCLLEAMPNGFVHTIDTFDGRSGGDVISSWPQDALINDVLNNLSEFEGRYAIVIGESLLACQAFKDKSIDLVFIDAGHDYQSVADDIEAWTRKVRRGGILCGHDYDKHVTHYVPPECFEQHAHLDFCAEHLCHPGVVRAVDEAFKEVNHRDSVWWVEL